MKGVLKFITRYWVLIASLLIIIVAVFALAMGVRIGPELSFVRLGTLSITDLPDGASAYVDVVRHAEIEDGGFSMELMPGSHTVIIETPGNEQWSELFTIRDATRTTLQPLLVPTDPKIEKVAGDDYTEAHARIWQTTLPSRKSPLSLHDGCIEVYVTGNRIMAEGSTATSCTPPEYLCKETCEPVVVHETPDALRSVLPHPSRDDALVIAAGGLLYVIELDPREPQFSAPLFSSAFIKAGSFDEDSVIATDGTKAYRIRVVP